MENQNTMKSLKERAKEMGARLPFMDNRDKGSIDELMGQVCTLIDYGFLPNEDGEHYVAFITRERPNKFYFGGAVLTARMIELDGEGYRDAIVAEGLPFVMTQATSKKTKRSYTNVVFYPED